MVRLAIKDLREQVLGDGSLAAGEVGREPVRLGVPSKRQSGETEPRRPALRSREEQRERIVRQLQPRSLEQSSRLLRGEPEIDAADLGELTLQPQPMQAQVQVTAHQQHESQLRWSSPQ